MKEDLVLQLSELHGSAANKAWKDSSHDTLATCLRPEGEAAWLPHPVPPIILDKTTEDNAPNERDRGGTVD